MMELLIWKRRQKFNSKCEDLVGGFYCVILNIKSHFQILGLPVLLNNNNQLTVAHNPFDKGVRQPVLCRLTNCPQLSKAGPTRCLT